MNANCLACMSKNIHEVLNLGTQKPVNSFGPADSLNPRLPLGLTACADCGHGQLSYFCDPKDLFSDYTYASSTSNTLKAYQKWFVKKISVMQKFRELRVLEMASNDGLLLSCLREVNIRALGIEPSERMARRSRELGHDVLLGYWPNCIESLRDEKFEIIIGQNVLAHNPNPYEFLRNCKEILIPAGCAIFQTSQISMVENGEFDTVYHEHYSFFCEQSAKSLANSTGFYGFGVRYTDIHGGSAIFFFAKEQTVVDNYLRSWDTEGDATFYLEVNRDQISQRERSMTMWHNFSKLAEQRMKTVSGLVESFRKSNYQIVAVGAAAKGITFLRAANIRPDFLLDEAVDKKGKFVDELDLKIRALNDFSGDAKTLYVITAWNFYKELCLKLVELGNNENGTVLTYYPNVISRNLGSSIS